MPNNVALIEKYYIALGKKDIETIKKMLHSEVEFAGPLAKLKGKDAVAESVQKFGAFLKSLKIRVAAGTGDQAMAFYDVDCPDPIGMISAAALMTFKDGLITNIELFYDARPFVEKKDEIFSKK